MSHTLISVEGLSKSYVIGHQVEKEEGLRHVIERAVRSPWNWVRSGLRASRSTREDFWALRDVNLEIKQGEVVGIIGRNGAGKSTLLKILSRITEPTGGRVRIRGRVASLLEVGTGFHGELTGRENIFLNGAVLGMGRAEIRRKFDEIVAFAGVEQFLDTPVKRYSSGMYVRLAFAVAAHLEPEILVVDEVLAVGDAEFQRKCLARMDDVARKHGRTVLFVSHNMAAVENLCTRGIVLHDGQVRFSGSQVEAIHEYLAAFSHKTRKLSERADRKGTGEVRIVSVALRDRVGNDIEVAMSGQDLDIWLYFDKQPEFRGKGIVAGVVVKTPTGVPVFLHHNRLTRDEFGELPSNGAFVCRIPCLPLPAATYSVGFSLLTDNGRGHYSDSIEDAFELLVVGGDFYGSGEVPPISHGVCLINARWTLEEVPQTRPQEERLSSTGIRS